MPASQSTRFLAIETALGADVLLLKSFVFREQLGRLFQLDVQLRSEGAEVDFDQIIGTNATVRLTQPNGQSRFFNGFVSQFQQVGNDRGFALYQAVLVPWLWFLTQTADCRIFQKKKIPEIIEDIFKAHGFKDYKLQLTGSYREREYCVQYRESDFNFVSRLMEQEGIYYFFTHENGVHHLMLADSATAHSPAEGYETIAFKPRTQAQEEWAETVTDWIIRKEVRSGAFAMGDFNFKTPAAPILVTATVNRSHEAAGFEVYDYPGEYDQRGDGEAYAKIRIQELQVQHETLRAQTTARGVATGRKFKLSGHYRADQNRDYLITSTELEATAGDFHSGADDGQDFYSGHFTAIPGPALFRSARTAPKPTIQGPQTAIVVGKAGEEIDTDEFGRVKVQFHWDRYGKVDENSSCWVRVSQAWAGKGWGALYLPRIGQEVIVEFLEGNPDQPIITGRVYNAVAKVPHELPQHKTISTIKSCSSKGGDGFNEIRFEDKKGEEQLFIHGEKNLDLRINHDSRTWTGNDQHIIIKKDCFSLIEGNRHDTVKGNHDERIEGDRSESIKGDHTSSIEGNRHASVKGEWITEVKGNTHLKVGGNHLHSTAQKFSLNAGSDIHAKAGANIAVQAGVNVHLKGGGTVVIEAGAQLSLKAAGSFIDIGPAGIFISGTPLVMINSGGSAASGSGSSPTDPSTPHEPEKPQLPMEATKADPGKPTEAKSTPAEKSVQKKSAVKVKEYDSAAEGLKKAAEKGKPFCEECKKEEAAQPE